MSAQVSLQPRAHLLHIGFALYPLFIEQTCHFAIGLWLQKAERQVLQLPLDLPDPQAIGQRRKHMQCLAGNAGRDGALFSGVKTQRLQTRCQTQQDHAQVARKAEQHLAHVLGLRGHIIDMLAAQLRIAGLLLHSDELDGFHRQGCKVLAKCLGNDFLRLVQMNAGMHQIDGSLHGFRATDLLEDGSHSIGVNQGVLPGFHGFTCNQRLGKGAGPSQGVGLLGQYLRGGHDQMRCGLRKLGRSIRNSVDGIAGLHSASSWACCARVNLAGRSESPCKNSRIKAT